MSIKTVRRLAADILKVGQNKIKIDPVSIKRAEEALTRKDVELLVTDGVIKKLPKSGRKKKEKRHNRKAKGSGNVKGKRGDNRKQLWMMAVRAQRKYLSELLTTKVIDKKIKRNIYGKVKSGLFKSKKAMFTYLKDNNLLVEKSS